MADASANVGSAGTIQIVVDLVGQDWSRNVSAIRVRGILINRSGTRSFNHNQVPRSIYGALALDAPGPFDVAGNSSQTVIDWTVEIGHDGNGYCSFGLGFALGATGTLTFGGGGGVAVGVDLPRIPKRPSPPGTPQFSEVGPTSLRVSWGGSGDDGGAGVDHYLLRYWPNAEGSGAYTDHSAAPDTSRFVSGLQPGTFYRFRVYAHNGSVDNGGYSNPSADAVVQLLAGAWIRVAGVWRLAIPYVRVGGSWKMAIPYVKQKNVWRMST